MCGIAGWASAEKPIDAETLVAMRDAMVHRGPDGAGIWLSEDRRIGLAHRRLSIIDLSDTANQPMFDQQSRAVIIFNGEIYNHRALRSELVAEGAHFTTDHSDTECLLHGYLHWGIEKLLERLVGMFAFAIYDTRQRQLHLVRDRIGIKPLYFAQLGGDLVFASEIKSLVQHPRVPRKLHEEAFYHYLTFRATPAPLTLFKDIECLAAGERIVYDIDKSRIQRTVWWNPLERRQPPPRTIQEADDRLADLLQSSVDYRLESDVPVGLFLSGGLDSGYLLQLMTGKVDSLGTYTVRYPEFDRYNEHHEARELADQAHAVYHDVAITSDDFLEALPAVAFHQDEPIAAPVCTSVYFLAKAAAETGRKVVLAGEGSDEVFVGYESWLAVRNMANWCRHVPAVLSRLVHRGLASFTSPYSKSLEALYRLGRDTPLFWGGSLDFPTLAKRDILGPAMSHVDADTYNEVVRPLRTAFLQNGDAEDTTAWMTYIDLRFRLPQLMLPRLDKMGMAHSIEGRVPFLDHRIIEFFLGLPPQWRGQTGKVGKAMLKRVAQRRLPHDFIYRRKRGFQAPVKEWQSSSLGNTYGPMLRQFTRETGLFNGHAIDQLLSRPNRLYFGLTNFMLWYSVFIENVCDQPMPFPRSKATV